MIFQRPQIIPSGSWKEKEAVDGVQKRNKSSLCPKPRIVTMCLAWVYELDTGMLHCDPTTLILARSRLYLIISIFSEYVII